MAPKRVIDITLIRNILAGHKNLFWHIVEEYNDAIFRHILKIINNKEEAWDLTNEIFAKVYLNLNLYKEEFKFNSWIYKLATNCALDHLRRKKLMPDVMHQNEDHNQISDTITDEPEFTSKNYVTLKDAINKLQPTYRAVIKSRYFEELSYEEISAKLNIPIGTVKAYIHRAKKVLAKLITNQ